MGNFFKYSKKCTYYKETCRDYLTRLASPLVRAPNAYSGGHEFEPPSWTWIWCSDNIEGLWGTVFYISDLDVIMSCLTCSKLSVWLQQLGTSLADSLARQTHLPGRLTCPTPLQTILLNTQVQFQRGTWGSCVEKPPKLRLAYPPS